jgi:hypothetical protein
MYSSTLTLTSALNGVGGQRHARANLSPGNTRYSLYGRLGGPQVRFGRVWKYRPHRHSIPGPSSESLYRLNYRGPRLYSI